MKDDQIFSEVAAELNLKLSVLSGGRLYRFSNEDTFLNVCGYYFDNNPSGAVEICRDKQLTSETLSKANILNVEHKTFFSPLEEGSPERGAFLENILSFTAQFDHKVVCKPPKTAGGIKIYFCQNQQEIETAAIRLVKDSQDVCISPYIYSEYEYRVYVLEGSAELVYKKERPFVMKNERDKLQNFLSDQLNSSFWKSCLENLLNRRSISNDKIFMTEQHNLSSGARASLDIGEELRKKLKEQAVKAANFIGIKFCSIDFFVDDAGRLLVLEVNPGIMTKIFLSQQGETGYKTVKSMYKRAIVSYFAKSEKKNDVKIFAN